MPDNRNWRKPSLARCIAQGITALVFSTGVYATPGSGEVYDVLIRGGTVYDGSGQPAFRADVAIEDDKVAAIGDLVEAKAKRVIDASGKAVSPGFINTLSWGVKSLIIDGRAISDVTQGITLEVFGEGHSMGPLNDNTREELAAAFEIVDPPWTTLGGYLEFLEARGVSPNIASFIGATTPRVYVLGQGNIKPNTEQLHAMQELVREAMREGALGVASALIYTPGSFAETDELVALATAAAEFNGLYASHIRGEGETLFESVDELITIARKARIPAEIYHLKAAHPEVWARFPELIEKIETARANGLRITADMYPYAAGSTGLDAIFPPWVREGGYEAWVKRLQDPAIRLRIKEEVSQPSQDWENMYAAVGPEKILLVGFRNPQLRLYAGKTLAAVAKEMNLGPEETAMKLVVEDGSRVGAVYFTQSEDVVRQVAVLPWVSFCTDTETVAAEGETLDNSIHPRGYGTFPRVLGRFVRDEGLMPLEEAIRKATALPAENLKIRQRGRLETGYFADVLVFDPAAIVDHATFESPHQYSTGVQHVFINGVEVIRDGSHTGATPGRVVRGPGWIGWNEE